MGNTSIRQTASDLRDGKLTSREIVERALEASEYLDPILGTYLCRFDETALESAERADSELQSGVDRGPLHGIPLGIKDIISTDEGPTSAQSLVQDPSWGNQGDGPLLRRLRAAGAVVTGKTTTMEYAIGFPDFEKPFPVPRNPWNTDRWTGGSSSGTANGIASGQFLGGLGTDTGGSVRLPAAYCGITGFKQTFGLVPKSGCIPLGLSYDHIGPMATSVWDCAAMLTVMAGYDSTDRTTVVRPDFDYVAALAADTDLGRAGVITNQSLVDASSDPMMAVFDDAVAELKATGIEIVPFEVPHYEAMHNGTFMALQAEAFSWHRDQLRDRWSEYGRPTRLTIAQGALISAGDLVQVERVRQVARKAVLDQMDETGVKVLLSPTTGYAATPFKGADRKAISLAAMHTPAWNSAGFPALSVPMGFDQDGLPCGLQIIGRPFEDDVVLCFGDRYQQLTDWHTRSPRLHADSPATD
ncbi:MAG TPA: amidase [Acidimicrobiales bacterium]|nr:amidase [Acidimicrobiales bacterium]